jgi:hypothetical protein
LKNVFINGAKGYRFNNVITFLKESFLPLLLFALLNFMTDYQPPASAFDIFNNIVSIAMLLISFSFYIFCFWIIIHYRNELHKEEIKEYFEEMVVDCK